MLTWNPQQGRPENLKCAVGDISDGKACRQKWSTGGRKALPTGSRVFLIRQGVAPKGVVAAGFTKGEPLLSADLNEQSHYVDVAWTMALDADDTEILTLAAIEESESLANVPWGIAGGGRKFQDEEATELERRWSELLERLGKSEVGLD
jgi:5-methylcytosine-specific restriction protein A